MGFYLQTTRKAIIIIKNAKFFDSSFIKNIHMNEKMRALFS